MARDQIDFTFDCACLTESNDRCPAKVAALVAIKDTVWIDNPVPLGRKILTFDRWLTGVMNDGGFESPCVFLLLL